MNTTPRIYVADLAAYNAGKLHGRWIDANQDPDDIQNEIAAMLRDSPEPNVTVPCVDCGGSKWAPDQAMRSLEPCPVCKATGHVQSAEEFAIHDHEGFGSLTVREFDSIERVTMLANLLDDHEDAVIATALEHLTDPDAKEIEDWISDCYAGTFRTLEDWAEEFLADTSALAEIPDNLRAYFDFEKYARDCELGGDIFTAEGGSGVLVFWNR